jgi:CheY-like chemotaxis protein
MKRVLVIEDNENNMELITFILESHGCQVLKATCGRAGYEQALRERPDFIILDIQLPDIMGTEVLRLIGLPPSVDSFPLSHEVLGLGGDEQPVGGLQRLHEKRLIRNEYT